ncbi:hypothetical protein [Alteromonas sp. a30]|uniref:hypothetical protein n=1 Tax=Alteromonas sp. a30 TaxID=2730917 RepID=UPI00227E90F1|nr:hypothetical protein [Alteromonas sp. a30]MCY7296554.1 hypothetical protein [Alteromonas sp. a30]
MKKVVLVALLSLLTSFSYASERDQKQNLFKCVDGETLSINASCMQDTFQQSAEVQQQSFDYANLNDGLSENVMATMSFYPDKMLIEVVAHADAVNSGFAAVSEYK